MRHNHTLIRNGEVVTVLIKDIFTGKELKLEDLPLGDYNKWMNGEHVQNAFPYLNKDQREILITGIGPESWNERIASKGKK
jgi:hypothetical protein